MVQLLHISPSSSRHKKLTAVFDVGGTIRRIHFGAAGYNDFTTYWKRSPAEARRKRDQYIARHGATESWDDPTTPATLSRYILWEHPTLRGAVREYIKRFSLV